jgi:glycine betaine/choline ABC-type transport system substrate-binding protein
VALAALVACSREPRIVVGSKNFTEQLVLGEILAQHIENRLQVKVDRKLNLGGTLLAHNALVSGEIDLYPEYTGTALMAILDLPPAHDPKAVHERVAAEYRERFGIEWLEPFGFNNTFAMVIGGQEARRAGLETVSDAAAAGEWILGTGYEFEGRPDGLPALNRAYGLAWSAAPRTMDLGLLYRALEQGEVTMVAANSTDGMLAKLDVRVLEDDRSVFPPYQAAVAVRGDTLARFSGLQETLSELAGVISAKNMRELNHQVDGEHRPVEVVARGFLQRAGAESGVR